MLGLIGPRQALEKTLAQLHRKLNSRKKDPNEDDDRLEVDLSLLPEE